MAISVASDNSDQNFLYHLDPALYKLSPTVAELQLKVEARLAPIKDKRYFHVCRVAEYAYKLALHFKLSNTDLYDVVIAALLHDWDKLLPIDELIQKAELYQLDLGVEYTKVLPLLHGFTAAKNLEEVYGPRFSLQVYSAIAKHTTADLSMNPVEMIVFIADALEPGRPDSPEISRLRVLAEETDLLTELYRETYISGMIYVLSTKRYLWPRSVSIYNELTTKAKG